MSQTHSTSGLVSSSQSDDLRTSCNGLTAEQREEHLRRGMRMIYGGGDLRPPEAITLAARCDLCLGWWPRERLVAVTQSLFPPVLICPHCRSGQPDICADRDPRGMLTR